MYLVNAVDSFCDMKLKNSTGHGEKKLYLSTTDSLCFAKKYLGIDIKNGVNIYNYNDEIRTRTIGLSGFIKKSNLLDIFNRSEYEYTQQSEYSTNLNSLRKKNYNLLDTLEDNIEFKIDCSLSKKRIYIGSKDRNWLVIPSFCIPKKSKIQIEKNKLNELEFTIIY